MPLVRLVATAAVALAACDDATPSDQDPTVYVGVLHDDDDGDQDSDVGDASLALAVQGNEIQVYACGDSPGESYPGWLVGTVRAGTQTALLEHDGWRLEVAWEADHARGRLVRPDGTTTRFTARPARDTVGSGLYATWSEGCMTGVIVDAAARAAGEPLVRGTWCNAAGTRRQVTPLRPLRFVGDHLTVHVQFDDGPRRLDVAPVRLSTR